MSEQQSEVIVYKTNDYNRFRMISGNRGLNEVKIKKIIKEIDGGNDVLKYYPIQVKTVGDMLEILDGQHRFFISQKLKRAVHFIILQESKSMADIAKINSNTEKWTQQNYINCYISQGNEEYKKLQKFLNTYGINVGTSLQLLTTGNPGMEGNDSTLTEKFQHGLILVTYLEEAVELAEICKRFSDFKYWIDRSFIIALYRIKKAGLISMDDLYEAYRKCPELLVKNYSYKNYVNNLEQIVNYRKSKRTVII